MKPRPSPHPAAKTISRLKGTRMAGGTAANRPEVNALLVAAARLMLAGPAVIAPPAPKPVPGHGMRPGGRS